MICDMLALDLFECRVGVEIDSDPFDELVLLCFLDIIDHIIVQHIVDASSVGC